MRAVVTRPVEDAERIAAPLRDRGVDVFIEPLLAVVTAAAAEVSLQGVQAFLLTSANGARALAGALKDHPHGFQLPALCVGDQTLRVAQEKGFQRVSSAEGDVHSLAALVRARLNPKHGALLHAAGSVVAGDLAALLEDDGFTVLRRPLYETRTAKAFSRPMQDLLRDGAVDAIFLYSPRTARTFLDLASKADLRDACRDVTAYCLSQAVADALGDLPFRLRIAPEPNQEALLTVFDEDNADAFATVPSEADPSGAGDTDPQGDGAMTERPKAGKTGDNGEAPKEDKDAKAPPSSTEKGTEASKGDAKPKDEAKAKDDAKSKDDSKDKAPKSDAAKPDAAKAEPAKAAAAKDSKPKATPASTGSTPKTGSSGSSASTPSTPSSSPAASTGTKAGTGGTPPSSSAAKPGAAAPSSTPSKGGVSGGVVAVLVILILLLGAWATLPIWVKALPPGAQETAAPLLPGGNDGAQVADLESRLASLTERLSDTNDTVAALRQRVAELESRPAAPATDANGDLSAEAQATLETLRQRMDQLAANQPQDLGAEIAALEERLGEIQANRADASTVLNLTDRVASVEQAVRQQESRQARAVAFLVAVGQLRGAVDSGRAFADELRSTRAVAPEGLALAEETEGWADQAGQGIPTLTGLRQGFAERADAIIRSSVTAGDEDTGSWWNRTVDRMSSVVSVRRTDGEAVGDGPAAIVSRAEQDLDAGDLSAAVAEVEKLGGGAADVAEDWLAAARARLAAEEGLAALTGEALARLRAADSAAAANGQEG